VTTVDGREDCDVERDVLSSVGRLVKVSLACLMSMSV
jgi:hypothetical protein